MKFYNSIEWGSPLYKFFTILTVFIFSLFALQASAATINSDESSLGSTTIQPLTISGTVTDKAGETLPGVGIRLKDSDIGASTDQNGNYSLSIPNGNGTLIFSYIGFNTQEVAVSGRSSINVELVESSTALDEIVVVGYGTQKRKDLTGSVSSVSADDFADMPVANISQALSGRLAGLDILSSDGSPGEASSILLRGQRSFTASNDPLIILDGMPFYGSINDINPYDINSIDVLKDASSTAIYGSRGSNGVIIITTKRGQTGKPRFLIESYAGIQSRYGRMPYADATQYAEWAREAFRASGGYPDPNINPVYDANIFDPIELETINEGGKGLDYQDLLLQNGHQQKHQLSIMGGSEAVRYNFATSYYNEEGIIQIGRASCRERL